MAGYQPVAVASDARGGVDIASLEMLLDDDLAGLMLTNPNTLGVFDENISEIARLVHEAGGLLYYDGANSNAVLGVSRPGDMGFDIVHFNTHKTFSTPHGGGGPGAGPIVVRDTLALYLPVPLVEKAEDGRLFLDYERPQSIGKMRTFYGNFGVLVRAKPAISASQPSSSYMSSSAPCTSDSGWYGCRPLRPSRRAATSFALGLYFMVHEPSG